MINRKSWAKTIKPNVNGLQGRKSFNSFILFEKRCDEQTPEKIIEIDDEDDEYSNNPITADSENEKKSYPKFHDQKMDRNY